MNIDVRLAILVAMVVIGLFGLAISSITKSDNGFLFSFFLFVAGCMSIGVFLTL